MELKDLIKAAKEIQEVMDLDVTPPLKAKTAKKVEDWIKEAAEYIDPAQDEFSDAAIAAFQECGVWVDQDDGEEEDDGKAKKKTSSKKKKAEPEPEDDDDDGDAEEDDDD